MYDFQGTGKVRSYGYRCARIHNFKRNRKKNMYVLEMFVNTERKKWRKKWQNMIGAQLLVHKMWNC